MPQAPEVLRKNWHYGDEPGDQKASAHLKPNFTRRDGVIRPKAGYEPTAKDMDAITYLVLEWDYAYDPKPLEDGTLRQ